jgi:hypothetical protein
MQTWLLNFVAELCQTNLPSCYTFRIKEIVSRDFLLFYLVFFLSIDYPQPPYLSTLKYYRISFCVRGDIHKYLLRGFPYVENLILRRHLQRIPDLVFRKTYCSATTTQWEIGGRLCTKCCENKCCSYLRNINTGSNCFFDAAFSIYPRFLIGKL